MKNTSEIIAGVLPFTRKTDWVERAKTLRTIKEGWIVGRTDMFTMDGGGTRYLHYAYPPHLGERVCFESRWSSLRALKKAVRYAEKMNGRKEEYIR